MRAFFVVAATVVLCVTPTTSQAAAASPAAPAPVAAQSQPVEKLTATCIKVKGRVQWAPVGTQSTDTQAWKPVRVGGEYTQGMQIRTGLRSEALLKFGDDTAVLIGRSTLAAIGAFYRSADTKTTRLGLDYGTVRAGVAEGGLRSDFQIDSPVATLSKRGTWNFSLWVERGTGRFEAKLADRGLLEILHKATGRTQFVAMKQSVNQAMMNWARTIQFNRQVVVADAFSQTDDELVGYLRNNTGRSGLSPAGLAPQGAVGTGGGLQGMSAGARAAAQRSQTLGMTTALRLGQWPVFLVPARSSDGDFGTGPIFISTAQKRAARRTVGLLSRSPFFRRGSGR